MKCALFALSLCLVLALAVEGDAANYPNSEMKICSAKVKSLGAEQAGAAGDAAGAVSGLDQLAANRKSVGSMAGSTIKDPSKYIANVVKQKQKLDPTQYAMTVAPAAAPAIVGFALTMLLICPCWLARCCCCNCCCCGPKHCCGPKDDEYGFFPKAVAVVGYIAFAGAALISALVGIMAIAKIMNGVTGMVCEMELLADKSVEFGNSIYKPVKNISDTAGILIDNVGVTINSTSAIGSGLGEIASKLTAYGTDVKTISISGYDLPLIQTVGDTVSNIGTQMNTLAGGLVTTLDGVRSGVGSKLVASKSMIIGVADMAKGVNKQLADMVEEKVKPQITALDKPVGEAAKLSGPAAYAIYSTVIISAALGILATVLMAVLKMKKIGLMLSTCSWTISCSGLFLMFLVGCIFMPLSMVFFDVCYVLDDVHKNVESYTASFESGTRRLMDDRQLMAGGLKPGKILDGCFKGRPIMQSLNMSSTFNFKSAIQFDNLVPDISSSLDFSQFDSFNNMISGLNASSFGMKESDRLIYETCCNGGDDYGSNQVNGKDVEGIVSSVSQRLYCIQNIPAGQKLCTDCTDGSSANDCAAKNVAACKTAGGSVGPVCKISKEMNAANTAINNTLTWMKKNMTDIGDSVTAFKSSITNLNNGLNKVLKQVGPLLEQVDNLQNAGDCTFLNDTLSGMKRALCKDALDGIFSTGICTCLCGYFGWMMFIFMIQVEKIFYYNDPEQGEDFHEDDGVEMNDNKVKYDIGSASAPPANVI
jgi:hypothetical protein